MHVLTGESDLERRIVPGAHDGEFHRAAGAATDQLRKLANIGAALTGSA